MSSDISGVSPFSVMRLLGLALILRFIGHHSELYDIVRPGIHERTEEHAVLQRGLPGVNQSSNKLGSFIILSSVKVGCVLSQIMELKSAVGTLTE